MSRLAFMLIFILIASCSNDDDNTTSAPNPDIDSSGLDGKWSLIKVTGGFIGVDHAFKKGDIVWDFNETRQTITVVNTNTDETIEDGLSTGTYDYSINSIPGGSEELLINDSSYGNFERINSEISIDEQFRDGFRYVFER